MIRRLAALLFVLFAMLAIARMAERSADVATMTAATAETEAKAPHGTGDTDSVWVAASRVIASLTESRWNASAMHAGLAAAPSGLAFITTSVVHCREISAGSRSAHLLHAPLLI